ncbi:ABC transporter ATP-binding protein [Corynebacterium aquilae]|uniref:ABC transporter domain-containing protein n=1 Tax=Corynebacterium aquilae DSM 44791 TaxID=1431546 RepID=A0A1L7CDS0_9CORY|nr:ABC transporter ATP-binding protein [Corynebacterium aquilae]APT83986.1 hypothetical protein CAQU_01640 [Corynebacterium aquilae DSM 44791]
MITTRNLATRHLTGINLDIPTGSWHMLIGPNGAGKTTLLKALAGLIPSTGELTVGDIDPRQAKRAKTAQSIALCPQRPQLPDGMSVRDYVLLGRTPHLKLLANPSHTDHRIVDDILHQLGLNTLATKNITHISGGELQRATLGRALATQAPVLLLDEPTSALDIGKAQQALSLIDDIRTTTGITVVAAIHDLTLAGQYGDHVWLIDNGEITNHGPAHTTLTAQQIKQTYDAHTTVVTTPEFAIIPTRHHNQH